MSGILLRNVMRSLDISITKLQIRVVVQKITPITIQFSLKL